MENHFCIDTVNVAEAIKIPNNKYHMDSRIWLTEFAK